MMEIPQHLQKFEWYAGHLAYRGYKDYVDAEPCKANLRDANLRKANLRDANLTGANLDFSTWPLCRGSLDAIIDEDQAAQLAFHLASILLDSIDGEWVEGLRKFANTWSGIQRHGLEEA